ncbi:MAG: hypothetical protein K0R48_235 [Gammaproteobacteria bacterium]|jgi:hypothetical protein|nr:hypothetical protein [Gammaproteobacteria bacterium]
MFFPPDQPQKRSVEFMKSDSQLANNQVADNKILEIRKNPAEHAVALCEAMNRFRDAGTVLSNIELTVLEDISADPGTVFSTQQGNIEAASKNGTATFSLSVGENGSILLKAINILPPIGIVDRWVPRSLRAQRGAGAS